VRAHPFTPVWTRSRSAVLCARRRTRHGSSVAVAPCARRGSSPRRPGSQPPTAEGPTCAGRRANPPSPEGQPWPGAVSGVVRRSARGASQTGATLSVKTPIGMRHPYLVCTLLVAAMATSGCSSVRQCFDRCARVAAYKRQLAKARKGGTRADVQAVFPAARHWARPFILGLPGPTGPEYYQLDSDYALVASFLYHDVRVPPPVTAALSAMFLGRGRSTTSPLVDLTPFIRPSPKDGLGDASIQRRYPPEFEAAVTSIGARSAPAAARRPR